MTKGPPPFSSWWNLVGRFSSVPKTLSRMENSGKLLVIIVVISMMVGCELVEGIIGWIHSKEAYRGKKFIDSFKEWCESHKDQGWEYIPPGGGHGARCHLPCYPNLHCHS